MEEDDAPVDRGGGFQGWLKQSASIELSGGFLEYISPQNSTPCRGQLLSIKLVQPSSWRSFLLAAATFIPRRGGGVGCHVYM